MKKMSYLITGGAALMVGGFICTTGMANNITVTRVARHGQALGSHWMVRFDVQWENSWRNDITNQAAPFNYDAAWVFMKYRTNNVSEGVWGDWKHASLSTNASDHVAPAGSEIKVGLSQTTNYLGYAGAPITNGVGVFIYRSANGSGTFAARSVRLRWNYAADGVADNADIELKVCAIEMVYVPTGAFFVGNTNGGVLYPYDAAGGSFRSFSSESNSFYIPNEDERTIYWGTNNPTTGEPVGSGVLSNAFPKGYSAFYGMKYTITQAQHVDFLNMLTRTQQGNRFISTTLSNFMNSVTGQTSPAQRNGVQLVSTNGTVPRIYANNLNTNNAPNSSDDGQWIACNYLGWATLAAYLDWAGLRPMTELEFEKACRGTNAPLASEFPWGTASYTRATNILNSGMANESPQPTSAQLTSANQPDVPGPMRVGCMGIGTGTRTGAGAGYYGMMNLAGDLTDRPVSVGKPEGLAFTGQHGDGVLTDAGNADVLAWPGTTATGIGQRGCAYESDQAYGRIAYRTYAATVFPNNDNSVGGRGVRTAP